MRQGVPPAAGSWRSAATRVGCSCLVLSCSAFLASLGGCYQSQPVVGDPDDAATSDAPEADHGAGAHAAPGTSEVRSD